MKTNIVNWIPYCNICGKPTQEITSTTGGVCRGHPNIEDELDDILKQFDIDAIADYWKSLADKRLELLKRCHFVIESLSNELGDYGADNWTRFNYLLDEIKQEEAIAEE